MCEIPEILYRISKSQEEFDDDCKTLQPHPDSFLDSEDEFGENVWLIWIADVVQFSNLVGHKVIISAKDRYSKYPTIEIYNGYRE
jgi:hypothetical protein